MSSSSNSNRSQMTKASTPEAALRREIEAERSAREKAEAAISELEADIRQMETLVLKLESGHYESDELHLAPSEEKQRYEHQRQLNLQLEEQKRWLEHELESVKLRMQNDKLNYPMLNNEDTFGSDWDNLSETELKRLVAQLERTKADLVSELEEKEARLNKAGKEFHHNDHFCQMYRAEIKSLNRTLEMLLKMTVLPSGINLVNNKVEKSNNDDVADPIYPLQPILAKASTGVMSPAKKRLPPLHSPIRKRINGRKMDLSPMHKARSVRNLPKINQDNEVERAKNRKKRFQSLSPDRKL